MSTSEIIYLSVIVLSVGAHAVISYLNRKSIDNYFKEIDSKQKQLDKSFIPVLIIMLKHYVEIEDYVTASKISKLIKNKDN